jgi:hypothetical protein
MRLILTIFFIATCIVCQAQNLDKRYNEAFSELKDMLADSTPLSFKRAVFVTEDAYLGNILDYTKFKGEIALLAKLSRKISEQDALIYNEFDKIRVSRYAAVFRLMKDSVKFAIDSTRSFVTKPYSYDFEDFLGEKNWQKMFVTKLLNSHSGNCHSLPFLYKIICEELGEPAWLAMAPNHMYIKLWSKNTGWYNTELTSGYFPIDAWIMASGYIHLNAVQNRLYMDTLSAKQSIAVCLVDLAKGFEKKAGKDGSTEFVRKCTDLALQHYPNYVNALLLKAETMKVVFEQKAKSMGAKSPADAFSNPSAKAAFDEMEKLYFNIHQLGYRTMPKDMYLSWLAELKEHKEKYTNTKILKLNDTQTR